MIIVATHHKTGTVLFGAVFNRIAQELSLNFYYGQQRRLPPDTQVWVEEHSHIQADAFTEFVGAHVIRHPLEVICSGYRHHLVCREPWCVSTAVDRDSPVNYNFGGLSYQQKLHTLSPRDGVLFEMRHRSFPVIMDMYNWNYSDSRFLNVRLEDVIAGFDHEFSRIFSFVGLDPSECLPIARRYDLKRLSTDRIASIAHITNKSGDISWPRYFCDGTMLDQFRVTFPDDVLTRLGYSDLSPA